MCRIEQQTCCVPCWYQGCILRACLLSGQISRRNKHALRLLHIASMRCKLELDRRGLSGYSEVFAGGSRNACPPFCSAWPIGYNADVLDPQTLDMTQCYSPTPPIPAKPHSSNCATLSASVTACSSSLRGLVSLQARYRIRITDITAGSQSMASACIEFGMKRSQARSFLSTAAKSLSIRFPALTFLVCVNLMSG